jgi:hypothetical protein
VIAWLSPKPQDAADLTPAAGLSGYCGGSGICGRSGAFPYPGSTTKPGSTTTMVLERLESANGTACHSGPRTRGTLVPKRGAHQLCPPSDHRGDDRVVIASAPRPAVRAAAAGTRSCWPAPLADNRPRRSEEAPWRRLVRTSTQLRGTFPRKRPVDRRSSPAPHVGRRSRDLDQPRPLQDGPRELGRVAVHQPFAQRER